MHLVVIDPGHGGKFHGAISPGPRFRLESALVLDIGWILVDELRQHDIPAILTRPNDRDFQELMLDQDLETRAWIANNYKANVFVSIHANSTGDPVDDVSGYEIWHYPDSLKGQRLAESIIDGFLTAWPERKNRGIKPSRYVVLAKTKMPAVLVEAGFLNNPDEDVWMHENKRQIAHAIAGGIVNYFKE